MAVDRRYGAGNKYGNGRLYGASTTPIVTSRFQWGIDVLFSSSNEAQYMTNLYMFRGRRNFVNPNGGGFAPVETGRARVTLDNSDGRYDAWNTSSPLYPNVQPGGDIRVRVRDLDTGTIYDVFSGTILDIQTTGYGADAKAILICEDYWQYLRNTIALAWRGSTNWTSFPGTVDVVVDAVLDAINWTHSRSLDVGGDSIKYWWTGVNTYAGNLIGDLVNAFFGRFFVAADGTATFYDRTNARASVQTYTQSNYLKDIGNPQPWINQRNTTKIRTHTRKLGSNVIVWTLGDSVFIPAHTDVTMYCVCTYNGLVTPVVNPVSNPVTDYHANTAEDGSGSDLTSKFVISESLNYGDTIYQRMSNTGATNGYLTDQNWVAYVLPESGSLDVRYTNGRSDREFAIDSVYMQSVVTAKSLAATYGPQIAGLRNFPIVTLDTRAEALVPDLFDIVNVSISKLGISATNFEVGGIEIQTTSETCQSFLVTHYLEPHLTG